MNETETVIHQCPQCGAPAKLNSNTCPYCHSEFIVKSLSSLKGLNKLGIDKYIASYKKAALSNPNNTQLSSAIAMCYLKLGLYDFASKFFEKAALDMIENSDVYYYAAVSQFKGKRPFLAVLPTIRKAEEYIQAALSLCPESGKCYYLLALVQQDYYDKKFLRSKYTYKELIDSATAGSITQEEIDELLEYVPVPR